MKEEGRSLWHGYLRVPYQIQIEVVVLAVVVVVVEAGVQVVDVAREYFLD